MDNIKDPKINNPKLPPKDRAIVDKWMKTLKKRADAFKEFRLDTKMWVAFDNNPRIQADIEEEYVAYLKGKLTKKGREAMFIV